MPEAREPLFCPPAAPASRRAGAAERRLFAGLFTGREWLRCVEVDFSGFGGRAQRGGGRTRWFAVLSYE